tara:strand:+ start:504 stop:797 length:294 start_codon:yes stop_codon:yes gene_type:complete
MSKSKQYWIKEYTMEYKEVDGQPFGGWVEVQRTDEGDRGDYMTPPHPSTFEASDEEVWLFENDGEAMERKKFTDPKLEAKAIDILHKWGIDQAQEDE